MDCLNHLSFAVNSMKCTSIVYSKSMYALLQYVNVRNIEFSIAFLLPSISETLSLAMASSSSTGNLLPYFDFDVQRNVTVTVGQTGFLHCRVERLGDKDVSIILHSKHFSYFIVENMVFNVGKQSFLYT